MTDPVAPPSRREFRLAVVCALPLEAESVRAVFDRCWEDEGKRYGKVAGDKNTYTTGLIGRHNVVLVLLPSMGGVAAAHAAASLSSSFPRIELVLVVGICGVLPVHPDTKEEIVMGDIVVSTAMTQYDYGRMYPHGFERKASVQDSLRKAPKEVQSFMNKLSMRQNRKKLRADIQQLVSSEDFLKNEPTAVYPGSAQDHLYEASYLHQHRPSARCDRCRDGSNPTCARDCHQLGCEKDRLINRTRHQSMQVYGGPAVHLGRFGSANTVMKCGADRDKLAAMEGLIAFEMEGTGVWDEHPTIVIKAACDYADSHKNKIWQPYAAMMAAACFKIILGEWEASDELIDSSRLASTRVDTPSTHRQDDGGMAFDSGGGTQTNNVNSRIETQINNNAPVGTQYTGPVIISQKSDLSFREPVGSWLSQAPSHNPSLFVGRDSDLEDMARLLGLPGQPVKHQPVVLGGKGGIGKTQLVLAYADRYRDRYQSIFWFDATSKLTIEDSFRWIAERLFESQHGEVLDSKQCVVHVHRWLCDHRNTKWLLIFDNHDDPPRSRQVEGSDQFMIQSYYPPTPHGSIIVTTRRSDLVAGQEVFIEPLANVEDSIAILATRSQREDARTDPYAKQLAKRLGGLPLALASAGAYLRNSVLTFQRYLQDYDALWNLDLYQTVQLPEYQDRTLYTTWQLSFDALKREKPEAAQLLTLLAYFDNQHLWYDLFRAGLNHDTPQTIHKVVMSNTKFDNVMQTLTAYCFLEVQQSTQSWSMHNCVHDWALAVLNKDIDMSQYWYAFDCVADSIHETDLNVLSHLRHARLAAHATRLAHESFWRDDYFSHMTIDRLERCFIVTTLLGSQAQFLAAERLHLRVLTEAERALGLEHPSTLNTVNNLGNLYCDQGKLDQAEEMYQRALGGKEKVLGLEHPSTLYTVNNLGILYRDQGKLDQAEEMYQRALAGYKKVLGLEHPSTLYTVNNLGVLYRDQGKLDQAEEMYQRALVGSKKVLGLEHPSTLYTVNNLGNLYCDQGKLDQAEEMYQRALGGKEKVLGLEHPSTLDTFINLGNLYYDQGKLDQAGEIYQRALTRYKKVLGLEHPSIFNAANNLGVLYHNQGKLDQAEELYQRALSGKEKVLGLEHPSTLNTVNNLSTLYCIQGNLDQAKEMYHRALAGYTHMSLLSTIPALNVVFNLGVLCEDQAKTDEAEKWYQRVADETAKALGPDHPFSIETAVALLRIRRAIESERSKDMDSERKSQPSRKRDRFGDLLGLKRQD